MSDVKTVRVELAERGYDILIGEGLIARAGDAVVDLLSLGDEGRAHAGMVRSIVSTELGHGWEDLTRLSKRLASPRRRRRS